MKKFIEIENVLKPLAEWGQNRFSNHAGNTISIGDNEGQISEEELQELLNLNKCSKFVGLNVPRSYSFIYKCSKFVGLTAPRACRIDFI